MSSVIEQFQAQISHAARQGQTMAIQGGNSKAFYGAATHSDAVLDTRAHQPEQWQAVRATMCWACKCSTAKASG